MPKDIGKKIKSLRLSYGMTQEELANKADVSKSIISAYEKGNRNPSFEVLEKISEIFNVKEVYFFETDEINEDMLDLSKLYEYQKTIIRQVYQEFVRANHYEEKYDNLSLELLSLDVDMDDDDEYDDI